MGERVVAPDVNCDSLDLGDTYEQRFDKQQVTCSDRRSLFAERGFTWGALETQLEPGDLCTGDFIYAMVLREPVNRLESQVNYRVDEDHLSPPCRYDDIIARIRFARTSPSFESQCRLQAPAYDNYVVRLLGGKETIDLPLGGVNSSHYDAAMAVLRQFDLVIPMEDISSNQAVLEMNRAFGWNLQSQNLAPHYSWTGRVEHAKERHAVMFSEQEVEHLRHINRFDIALYDHVKEQFRSRGGD